MACSRGTVDAVTRAPSPGRRPQTVEGRGAGVTAVAPGTLSADGRGQICRFRSGCGSWSPASGRLGARRGVPVGRARFGASVTTTEVEHRARPRVFGESLSTHRNSLNFLRLALASIVLLSHAAGLGGFSSWEGIVNQTSAAEISLYGFFAISGYLIAQSVTHTAPLGYLWRRFLRIMPGLVVCLIIIAFGFGLVAWYHHHRAGCGVGCYFGARNGPFTYVVKNALLANPFWVQHTIAGTPQAVPDPFFDLWNASIWTLFYEGACYIMLLAMALLGLLTQRIYTLLGTVGLWLGVTLITVTPRLSHSFGLSHYEWLEAMLRFSEIFLTATVLYLYRDRVRDSVLIAALCVAIYAIGLILPLDGRVPTFQFTPSDIFLPALVYPVLWLGIHLPFQRVGARNDYSYGIYIYGWPVTMLICLWGWQRSGLIPYLLACVACTLPFAVGSWWLVEKRALALKSLHLGGLRAPNTSGAAVGEDAPAASSP